MSRATLPPEPNYGGQGVDLFGIDHKLHTLIVQIDEHFLEFLMDGSLGVLVQAA